jgi:oligopeptide/dipeptide ABC transporter ATP-binding protein
VIGLRRPEGRAGSPQGAPTTVPGQDAGQPLLDIRDLTLQFNARHGLVRALNGVNLSVRSGERVGIVGESGSGKSVTALSILRLARGARVAGEIRFAGEDLLTASEARMREIRGKEIGYIFQDPLSALNPVRSVGDQISEVLRLRGVGKADARRRTLDMLQRVGIKDAARRIDDYPHQFSGGMRQRVMIAMALVGEPRLVLADEPTTALDVRVQAQVLDLLWDLATERDLAVVLITHDLGIVAGFAERVVVMYAGQAMEQCSTDELFRGSIHPYTLGLLHSLPRVDGEILDKLTTIGGTPPSPSALPSGCPFHPRCRYALDLCREERPAFVPPPNGTHPSACHRAEWLAESPGVLR